MINTLSKAIKQRFARRAATRVGAEERRRRLRDRRWFRWLRRAGWILVGLYFFVAVGLLMVRYLVVPKIPQYREDIAAMASHTLGQRVSIEEIKADWHGLHPRVELLGVRIYDQEDREVLRLPRVRAVVAWRSVGLMFMYFRSIELEGLQLDMRRTADGKLHIAGLDMSDHSDTHIADWLLQQGTLHLKDARIVWVDEMRDAPPLALHNVNFLMINDGNHHRFALHAEPPVEHASAIDLRGDLEGSSAAQLLEWNGRFYIGFNYLDLAVWKPWLDYPFEMRSGRGALRLWLGFAQDRLVEAHAQVALADVTARFAKQLPLLEVQTMEGEAGAEEKQLGFSLVGIGPQKLAYDGYARNLSLVSRGGVRLQPADFTAHWEPGNAEQQERGSLQARSIDLKPLAALSDYLPLPQKARSTLDKIDPRGALADVEFVWSGPFETPETYSARGKFSALGMRAYGHLPGFSNLSGSAELSEKGGEVAVKGEKSTVDYPGVFPAPLHVESLSADLNWRFEGEEARIVLESVSAENDDGSASLSGEVRIDKEGKSYVDLKAAAPRLRAAGAYRYIPYLSASMTEWLRTSLTGGQAEDLSLVMRGATADFPYNDPQRGEFKVSGKLDAVQLNYATGWPQIDGIQGSILFKGPALSIQAERAQILGAKLARVQADFDDLYHQHPVLKIEGQAEGPADEFLKFIAQSPVRDMLGRATDGWGASGEGKLRLAFDMPLADMKQTKVRGSYDFLNNNFSLKGQTPVNKLSGTVDFTENSAVSKNLQAQFFGGTANMQIATQGATISLAARGNAEAGALARFAGLPFADRVRGPFAYRIHAATNPKQSTASLESNLQGVSIDLPAPLTKAAPDALPLKADWATQDNQRQSLNITLGKVFAMQGLLRKEGERSVLDRAGIVVGDAPMPKPEGSFILFTARADSFDIDRSLSLFADTPGSGTSAFPPIDTLDLRVNTLVAGGRLFNDVNLRAQLRNNTWRANVKAREVAGNLVWLPEGRGVLRARLQYLIHPAVAPQALQGSGSFKELPELDVEADSYTLDGRNLGRLDLDARNEAGLWRIQSASLSAPEGTANLKGLWRTATDTSARTELEFEVQSSDIGRYLERVGQGELISRGEGSLKGTVGWSGPPFAIDYPSLQGDITLLAEKGQFLKVKPGIGKLLGVLSLQSLPRRLTLDFRDVFSEGFAFDRIEGSAAIAQGVMSTTDLSMAGPSAQAAITGSADLQRETQDLRVKVIPIVGDSLATIIGLSILNPFAGAGAWLGSKLFNDPIGRMLAFEYKVSGSWEDPLVEKVGGPQQAAAAQTSATPSP